MLLESVVYPYILSSLIVGLGSLAPARTRELIRASWVLYLFLWIVVFAVIQTLAQAFPSPAPPIEIKPSAQVGVMDLLRTLVPENLTAALSQNLVPAIVVFAVMFGAAVQSVQSKTSFLEVVEAIRLASLRIWQWVVYLAPIGVFALFASTAGTIEPRMAGSLAVYLALFLLGTFLLAFVLLPLALSAIAPISWREILADLRPAFVLALVTTLPTSALPLIQGIAERRISAAGHADEEAKDVTRATISLAYVFASLGNYFVALFIIYAAQHFRVSVEWVQKLMLPPITLLSSSGAPSTTISAAGFMAQWLGLPSETVPLYVEAMTVTRYGQVALSVSAYAFIGIAVPFIYFRCASWRPLRAIAAIVLALVLFVGTASAIRALSDRLFSPGSDAAILDRRLDPDLMRDVPAVTYKANADDLSPITGPATLDGIRDRGFLRVGYGRDIVPFDYENASRDLVGFDISFAYRLAHDLHVRLELVPFDWGQAQHDLINRRLDIVMAGMYVTEARLENLQATNPYFQSPVAFIARSDRARQFLTYGEVARAGNLKLGALRDSAISRLAQHLFPSAQIVPLTTYNEFADRPDLDAVIWSLDQARAWASGHSGYTAVAASGMGAPFMFAYFLPPDATTLTLYLNAWLALQSDNGFREAQIAYWVDGKPRAPEAPRWNLFDNILVPAWQRWRHG
jgi:Na+/H+-dicarboxylate symporter/ABC-type amino acid transport substrate-binding protein